MGAEQILFGRQHHVGSLVLHPLFHQRHRDPWQVGSERLKTLEHRLLDGAEKAGDPLNVEDVDELISRAMRKTRPERLISHLD